MDESLYLKFYLKLTAILDSGFEKNLTICLTRYRNYNKEKICVIKRSFIHPRWQGITEFLSKIYLNSYTQELRIYSIVFPLFSSERLKAGMNILNWSKYYQQIYLLTWKHCEIVSRCRNSLEKENSIFLKKLVFQWK